MKHKFTLPICVFLMLVLLVPVSSQVNFIKSNNLLSDVHSTISILSTDMNNDQHDDLVFLDKGNTMVVQLNNAFNLPWKRIDGPVVTKVWASVAVDLNNDGNIEIVLGYSSSPIRIYSFDYKTETFTLYWEGETSFFSQNINAMDINKDGLLDIFACNDIGENHIYINDGNNGFTKENPIDFSTNPSSDNSGNYASQFVDFDLDGDEDLYITKCSAFADGPTDPRRINQLFVNNGDGNYTEQAEQYGLAIGAQSWTTDFADIDLDGDLDILIGNHFEPLNLMENMGDGTYQDIALNSGLELEDSFWEIIFHDMDNDGYEDLIIAASDMMYYHNNGDKTFSGKKVYESVVDLRNVSFTIGDYTQDGFFDICAKYGGFNASDNFYADSVFLNEGNDNNWIAMRLEGVGAPKDAVGSTVKLFADGMSQVRQLRIGRSYGIMNSPTIHFGIGQKSAIDSIQILWTDGQTETLYNPLINRYHYVKQGTCNKLIEEVNIVDYEVCEGASFMMEAEMTDFMQWSNTSEKTEIEYSDSELIFAHYGTNECLLSSWKLYPIYMDTSQVVEEILLSDGVFPFCPGQEVELQVRSDEAIWNDGEVVGSSYISTNEEDIHVMYQDGCKPYDLTYKRIDVESDFLIEDNVIEFSVGEDILIDVHSPYANWYYTETSNEPFYTGAQYTFENQTQNLTFFVEDNFELDYSSKVGETEPINGSYPGGNINASIFFNVTKEILLESIDVYTTIEGTRRILLFDANTFEIIASKEQFVDATDPVFTLDIILEPGSYYIKTDESVNIMNFNQNGPLFYRHSGDINYPYSDEQDAITITNNSFGIENTYYFFYNWRVSSPESKVCIGEKEKIVLQSPNSTQEELLDVQFNNPVQYSLQITMSGKHSVSIYNAQGILCKSFVHKEFSDFDVSEWPQGMYYLKIGNRLRTFVIQR